MLFLYVVFIFGTVSAIRTLHWLVQQSWLVKKSMTKIGTTVFLIQFAIIFLTQWPLVFRCLSVFALILLLFVSPVYFRLVRELHLQKTLPHFVKNVVLQMKIGMSFRASLQSAIAFEKSEFNKRIFEKIYEDVVFTQHTKGIFYSQMLLKVVRELKSIDESPSSALQRLENLYSWLKIQSEFRRKSGKILARMRAQSIVVMALFFAVVIFVGNIFGYSSLKTYLSVATAMMLVGTIFTFVIGRRMKWKL